MNELQPINQNVLLELDDNKAEQKTASGLIIPDSAKEKQSVGSVTAIGNIEDAELTVGDKVLYKEFSGTEFDFEGKKYLMIEYSDILAKVVKTDSI